MKNKRRWLSMEERRRIVAGYARSGQSPREYVRNAGIGLSTLGRWCRQVKKRKRGKARLVEVDVAEGSPMSGRGSYRLTLSGGVSVEFGRSFEVSELRSLLELLKESR